MSAPVHRLLTILISLVASLPTTSPAQESELGPCATFEELSAQQSEAVDKLLIEIDQLPQTAAMIDAHIQLMQTAAGALSYCNIESRLRRLGGKTYLLALPYRAVVGDKPGYSLTYLQPRFPTWSQVPKYAIWYERRGYSESLRRLAEYAQRPEDNLANLNYAGVVIEAAGLHPSFTVVEIPKKDGLPETYSKLYEVLEQYRNDGNLDNSFNPSLMHAIDQYLPKGSATKYTLNDRVSAGVLQFYVIDKDPARLTRNFPCSCAFIPKSSIILCDRRVLHALSNWAVYGEGGERHKLWALSIMNDGIADLLLHWIVGHEIGHYSLGHDYSASFITFDGNARQAAGEKNPVAQQEATADAFAFSGMPARIRTWGHMTTNFLIQQMAGIALGNDARKLRSKEESIVVRDDGLAHPNLLTRAFSLKNATGAVDFLLEEYESRTVPTKGGGAQFPGVCALSSR
ncbi:hypothetical protein ABXN37_24430 [Piscinibacter sakaiensis]|uniref:hypothetical protein n=1 Tax=Piscinibacter sakaiensis TaxID=1547922 RepID=UPI0012F7428C|nr:hypothetical protein [Piscinibacter sakaiensis]